ncbi:MAG: Grx4 family monothiol glutaredoxin [Gammaproteobacteria bacterium]|nr:MAG: Grx4 family monothiol glutaredoxin [Gammaproteobacteria bacterium]
MDVMDRIRDMVESSPVVVFIKGTPQFPQCGFSSQVVTALKACDAEFTYLNVLEDPEIRENLPKYSHWPTFPQVFVKGELIGGCDIIVELFEKGELQKMVAEVGGKEVA